MPHNQRKTDVYQIKCHNLTLPFSGRWREVADTCIMPSDCRCLLKYEPLLRSALHKGNTKNTIDLCIVLHNIIVTNTVQIIKCGNIPHSNKKSNWSLINYLKINTFIVTKAINGNTKLTVNPVHDHTLHQNCKQNRCHSRQEMYAFEESNLINDVVRGSFAIQRQVFGQGENCLD